MNKTRRVCGVGINDYDGVVRNNPFIRGAYNTWRNMLMRCYCKHFYEKYPTYQGCSVDESWHRFSVFLQWYCANHKEGWQIDKDLLFRNNKRYSTDTCVMLPAEINTFLTNNKSNCRSKCGVHKEYNGKFIAQIRNKGVIHLGTFNTEEEAYKVYAEAKRKRARGLAEEYKDQLDTRAYNALVNYNDELYSR